MTLSKLFSSENINIIFVNVLNILESHKSLVLNIINLLNILCIFSYINLNLI